MPHGSTPNHRTQSDQKHSDQTNAIKPEPIKKTCSASLVAGCPRWSFFEPNAAVDPVYADSSLFATLFRE